MKAEYSYMKRIQFMDSISIDDIGNVIIEGYNDLGDRYFLIIRTLLGVSRILEFGPLQEGARTNCICLFQQMDYNDVKIDRLIDKFLNDKKMLTQVTASNITSKEDLLKITNSLPNVVEFLYD